MQIRKYFLQNFGFGILNLNLINKEKYSFANERGIEIDLLWCYLRKRWLRALWSGPGSIISLFFLVLVVSSISSVIFHKFKRRIDFKMLLFPFYGTKFHFALSKNPFELLFYYALYADVCFCVFFFNCSVGYLVLFVLALNLSRS